MRRRANRLLAPLAAAALLAASAPRGALAGTAPAGTGELDARLVRVSVELDVFAPAGNHVQCNVKLLAPLSLPPQAPLRIAVASQPMDQVKGWRLDEEGMLSIDLKDQVGEQHLLLRADFDVLLMNGVGFDDTAKKTTLYKRAVAAPLKPWLRPLPGAASDDVDLAKAAAELKGVAADLIALVRAADELVGKRVREDPGATQDAGEALRKGSGARLGRARLTAALVLAQGVPTRLLGAIPARGGGDLHFLGDFHAGDPGWLRLDLAHRHAPAFPWPEVEDVVLSTIDADTPLAANARPRSFFCRGGLTAGPKTAGAPLFSCRELAATTCSRATAKEIGPVLAAAFADARKAAAGLAPIDVLAAPRAQKCRALVDWSAPLAKALADGAAAPAAPKDPPKDSKDSKDSKNSKNSKGRSMSGWSGLPALVVALGLRLPQEGGAIGLEAWRSRLGSGSAAERVTATAQLRNVLRADDVDAALAALAQWPPTPALHLRSLLVDLPLLRVALLERCFPAAQGELARELLVESFRARAQAQEPFRAELDTASEPRLPWADHGLWVRRTGLPRARLPWTEIRRALADAGAWSQPIVLFPGAPAAEIAVPRVAQAPAESWLEIELARRGLVPLRRAVATWIVSLAQVPAHEHDAAAARQGGEIARLVASEQELLAAALVALDREAPFERGRLGADLLAQLGMGCVAPEGRDDDFARGVIAARAPPAGSLAAPVAMAGETLAVVGDPRAALLDCAQRLESGALAVDAGTRELRDLVDGIADRLAREPLLAGELAERLREGALSLDALSPARTPIERASRELWLLGRSSRPGTRLVDLPAGAGGD